MTLDEHRKVQFSVRCQITKRTEVIVEAESEKEALEKFYALDWIDEHPCGETVDFTHDGIPKAMK